MLRAPIAAGFFVLAGLALASATSRPSRVADRAPSVPAEEVSSTGCPYLDGRVGKDGSARLVPEAGPPAVRDRLPPGHPPIDGHDLAFPPGRPPVDGRRATRLPPGHPPVEGAPALAPRFDEVEIVDI